MENNERELTPKELLAKLKESINKGPEEPKSPEVAPMPTEPVVREVEYDGEPDDAQILAMREESPVVEPPVKLKYAFKVRRPEAAPEEFAEAEEDEPAVSVDELLPDTDTDIEYEKPEESDLDSLMQSVLSEEELSDLKRIGSRKSADQIAEEAAAESEAAYEAGEDAFTITDEVELVYGGQEDYYSSIDDGTDHVTVPSSVEEDDEPFVYDEEPQTRELDVTVDDRFREDGSIVPDADARINAMNYITSLTKMAAASAATAEAVAEEVAEEAVEVAQEAIDAEPAQAAEEAAQISAEEPVAVTEGDDEAVKTAEAEPVAEETEETAADEHQIPEDFDDVDVNLMIAFGMEEELKDAIGEAQTEKITAAVDEDAKAATATDLLTVVDEEKEEFTDFTQTKGIFARYKRRYRKTLLSLGGSILVALLLFLFENLPAFGIDLPKAISREYYPVVNLMVGLQLSLFSYVLVADQIKRGITALIEKKWMPEVGITFVVGISFVYQLFMSVFCRVGYVTYNFPVALCVVLSLAYEFLNLKREIYSFNVVASKKMKHTLCALPYESAEKERDAFRSFYEVEKTYDGEGVEVPSEEEEQSPDVFEGKPMYALKQGAFVDGFFQRMRRYPAGKAVLGLTLPTMAIISLVFFLIAWIRGASFTYGVSMGYFALVMCAPMSIFITYSYPLYKASRKAFANESAIIGEAAAEEYLDAEEISFEDKDLFPGKGVKVKSIKVFGTHRIDRVVFNAANIFRKYGGPLSQVFNMATLELGITDEVYFGVIEEDGIEAMVGGSHIYLGKADYLRRKGYEPGYDDEDEVIEGNGGICVMFMAIEDEVAAKFYVEYTIDHEFEAILRALYSSGVCIGVRTFDPNIDDRMLQLLLHYEDYPVRAIKCRSEQSPNLAKEHLDSGIVSRRSAKDMLRAFMSCDRVLRAIKLGAVVKMVSLALGAVITLIAIIMAAKGIPSAWAVLYQLFWLLPVAVFAKLSV